MYLTGHPGGAKYIVDQLMKSKLDKGYREVPVGCFY